TASPSSPCVVDGHNIYTVVLRGETFELSKTQIECDSPNFFMSCFLSEFSESARCTTTLDQNPIIFVIIVDYLSGYLVLPLSLGQGMDTSAAHRYLLADAEFYGLSRLCALLTQPMPSIKLCWMGYANEVVSLFDVVKGKLPEGVEKREDGRVISTHSGLPVLVHATGVV
ncbi:hypothetical protein LXA43DRAFT_865144, partial [Ganoderma leucocontextum]